MLLKLNNDCVEEEGHEQFLYRLYYTKKKAYKQDFVFQIHMISVELNEISIITW